MLAMVQWACIAAHDDYDDDDDDVMIMSHCTDVCATLTDCGSCLSAGAQCHWSVLKQQVCYFNSCCVAWWCTRCYLPPDTSEHNPP